MNIKKILGLAAIAGLLFVAAPNQRASAMSLNNPGIAAAVQGGAAAVVTTEVQYRNQRGFRGHRGHFRPHHGFRRHGGWRRPHFSQRHRGYGGHRGHGRHRR
ncbi:hypothetical protein [Tardiphaga sp.]|uniref:hypothetical protein n=1 Tax=Tardiphaga sp. TaxID=1926292 RepID=UPI0025DFEE4A|nr:hypothetical protein [Tardiphaga sp.]